MDFFEAVNKRHSYRGQMKNKAVPREDLRRIVQAGLLAPSGCNKQTTTFVIADDPGLVRQIGAMHPKNQAVQTAQAFIVAVVDRNPPAAYEGLAFQVEDCSAAVENMLLAVTALGYASVWVDGWLRVGGNAEKIGGLLGVPESKIARVILPIGIAEDTNPKRPEKKPFEERAWFNRHGA